MGVSSRLSLDAWHRDGPHREPHHRKAQAVLDRRRKFRAAACLIFALVCAVAAQADTARIALFHTELSRDGPGILLADILDGEPQIEAIAAVVEAADPDVLVLLDVDYDLGGATIGALADALGGFPYRFSLRPNRGRDTGRDLDGDGRRGEPEDRAGYAEFSGQSGMAVLSRLPIRATDARDFSNFAWGDLPQSLAGPEDAAALLSTTGHWDVPVRLPDGRDLHILTWHATPSVFDGPDDRNGRRNHDEAAFWLAYLDGRLPSPPPPLFVLAGGANLDVIDGDGRPEALLALLQHPKLYDIAPASDGGIDAAERDGGLNLTQAGDAALDTADWPETGGYPGNLRVDYVLPSRSLGAVEGGVFWPRSDEPMHEAVMAASRHRLIWVDIPLHTRQSATSRP